MPTMIIGPDDLIHIADPGDPSLSLCPDTVDLCGADMVNPAVAVPVTCTPCRIENGKRIRARMETRARCGADDPVAGCTACTSCPDHQNI